MQCTQSIKNILLRCSYIHLSFFLKKLPTNAIKEQIIFGKWVSSHNSFSATVEINFCKTCWCIDIQLFINFSISKTHHSTHTLTAQYPRWNRAPVPLSQGHPLLNPHKHRPLLFLPHPQERRGQSRGICRNLSKKETLLII